MNLYRVELQGSKYSAFAHGVAYVIASNADAAYRTMRECLARKNIGSEKQLELWKIELVASPDFFPACGTTIYTEPKQ